MTIKALRFVQFQAPFAQKNWQWEYQTPSFGTNDCTYHCAAGYSAADCSVRAPPAEPPASFVKYEDKVCTLSVLTSPTHEAYSPPTVWKDGTPANTAMPDAESCKQECAKHSECSGFDFVSKNDGGRCIWRLSTLRVAGLSDVKWVYPNPNFGTGKATGIKRGEPRDCYLKHEF